MGIFSRLFGNEITDVVPRSRDPGDDFWYSGDARRTQTAAQVHVTVQKAREVPVVRDSLAVLSQSIGGLSFGAFRWVAQNERQRLDDHPVMRLFSDPNDRDTSYSFVVNLVDDLAAWGFFVGVILAVDPATGLPIKIRRLDPSCVLIEELPDLSLRFRYRASGGREFTYLEEEVWYIPTPPLIDGYAGRSAILHDGREAIAAIIGLQDYANAFWGNDATPPFIFKYGSNFKDRESKDNFLRAWYMKFAGKNRGRPGLLEYGIEIEKLGINNQDSQFLETRKELALDIARLWRMPPHKVGILDRATYSNIEQQSLEFVVDTLVPWLRLIERSVQKFLIQRDDVYFQFNVSSLLRGDTKARFEAYAKGRQWGWISVNEIRAMENMNGIGPAGDRYIEPLNMIEAGEDRNDPDRVDRSEQQARALGVLHATIPRIKGSTVEGVERALDGDVLSRTQRTPNLKVVGGNDR